jgi:hypothetical protein
MKNEKLQFKIKNFLFLSTDLHLVGVREWFSNSFNNKNNHNQGN